MSNLVWGDGRAVAELPSPKSERPWLRDARGYLAWPCLLWDVVVEDREHPHPGLLLLQPVLGLVGAGCAPTAIGELMHLDKRLVHRVLDDARVHDLLTPGRQLTEAGWKLVNGETITRSVGLSVTVVQDAIGGLLLGATDGPREVYLYGERDWSEGELGHRLPYRRVNVTLPKQEPTLAIPSIVGLPPRSIALSRHAGRLAGRVDVLGEALHRWLLLPTDTRRGDAPIVLDPFAPVPTELGCLGDQLRQLTFSDTWRHLPPETVGQASDTPPRLPEAFSEACSEAKQTLLRARRSARGNAGAGALRAAAVEVGRCLLAASQQQSGFIDDPVVSWWADAAPPYAEQALRTSLLDVGLPCSEALFAAARMAVQGSLAGLDAHLAVMLLDRSLAGWVEFLADRLQSVWADAGLLQAFAGGSGDVDEEFDRLARVLEHLGQMLMGD